MSNAFSLFRSLIIYAICLPLAIFLGYLLATPDDFVSFGLVTLVLVSLALPLFLRWHHPLLILTWNMAATAFFLPGSPSVWLVVCGISLTISVLQHALNKNQKFIHVPALAWPLIFLAIVTLVTAKLTGGMGIRSLGGHNMGGKRYIYLLAGIAGYFAVTARPVPPHRARLYVGMFFLGALTAAIGSLAAWAPRSFWRVFALFPPDYAGTEALWSDPVISPLNVISRSSGLAAVGVAVFAFMLALYGTAGLSELRKPWRWLVFLAAIAASLYGGFRSAIPFYFLTLAVLFFLEGSARSRLLPALILVAILGATIALPFTNKLPLSVQRSISFLPFVEVDPLAAQDAEYSTQWRWDMWEEVWPEVPQHLLLGKGYSMDGQQMEMLASGMTRGLNPAAGAILAGDYHSGPLSLVIPLGIFGVIAVLWFFWAAIKALYQNYKFGDPENRRLNRFLFAYFVVKVIFFFAVFGALYSDIALFAGLAGLSVAINGGVRKPMAAPAEAPVFTPFKLAGAVR
jgi:hypothetical protein